MRIIPGLRRYFIPEYEPMYGSMGLVIRPQLKYFYLMTSADIDVIR